MLSLGIPEEMRETIMCKIFASSLKGVALSWFYWLKLGSIDSFEEFSRIFQLIFIQYESK